MEKRWQKGWVERTPCKHLIWWAFQSQWEAGWGGTRKPRWPPTGDLGQYAYKILLIHWQLGSVWAVIILKYLGLQHVDLQLWGCQLPGADTTQAEQLCLLLETVLQMQNYLKWRHLHTCNETIMVFLSFPVTSEERPLQTQATEHHAGGCVCCRLSSNSYRKLFAQGFIHSSCFFLLCHHIPLFMIFLFSSEMPSTQLAVHEYEQKEKAWVRFLTYPLKTIAFLLALWHYFGSSQGLVSCCAFPLTCWRLQTQHVREALCRLLCWYLL